MADDNIDVDIEDLSSSDKDDELAAEREEEDSVQPHLQRRRTADYPRNDEINCILEGEKKEITQRTH